MKCLQYHKQLRTWDKKNPLFSWKTDAVGSKIVAPSLENISATIVIDFALIHCSNHVSDR